MAKVRFPAPPKRVQLQQLRGSDTAGSRGSSQKTWKTIETVYASIVTKSGNEPQIGREIEARQAVEIQMHYTSTLTPTTRIVHGSNTYEISSIDNVEARDRWLIAQCVRVV